MEAIQTKLKQLAELQALSDLLALERQEAIDRILTPEIKTAIAGIEVEFSDKIGAALSSIEAIKAEIKADVLAFGATVKADRLQAVWMKPRVSWDARALDGYAVGHPELFAFRKEGEASVTFRSV